MIDTAHPGAMLLYSTTPEGSQAAVIAHVHAREPGRDIVRLLVLQTPLDEPQADEVARLQAQFSGYGLAVQADDAGLQTRDDAARVEVLAAIGAADVILATGGEPERMVRVLADTPALAALRAAHERGVVIGGGSAGAMVYGAGYLGGSREHRRPVPLLGWLPDIAIAPHFGRYPIAPWQRAWPGKAILGLRDGAVVMADGDTLTSLGQVPATIIEPPPGLVLHGDFDTDEA